VAVTAPSGSKWNPEDDISIIPLDPDINCTSPGVAVPKKNFGVFNSTNDPLTCNEPAEWSHWKTPVCPPRKKSPDDDINVWKLEPL